MNIDPNGYYARLLIFPYIERTHPYDLPKSFCSLFWHNVVGIVFWACVLFIAVHMLIGVLALPMYLFGYVPTIGWMNPFFQLAVGVGGFPWIAGFIAGVCMVCVELSNRLKPERRGGYIRPVQKKKRSFIAQYIDAAYARVKKKTCPIITWESPETTIDNDSANYNG